tara:strand:- start:45 stop:761 length:717 start_codon:yes stop_codon:yes gene_type:complete
MTITTLPNLAGVIKTSDLYKKMKFDYVPWAKTAQLLREHAPGWQFFLKPSNPNGDIFSYVHTAPDNTGFLMGYFEHIETGKQTSPNVFAITDNANRPISLEKISCNSIQNSHRRCLCACACKDFGLAYELWAQIEVEEAKQTPPEKEGVGATRTKPNEKLESVDVLKKLPIPITAEAKKAVLDHLATFHEHHPETMKKIVASFRDKFGIKDTKITKHITTLEHGEFLTYEINKILENL